jgi:hypothetical protein
MNVIRKSGMTGVPDGFCELATEVDAADDQWRSGAPKAITAASAAKNS